METLTESAERKHTPLYRGQRRGRSSGYKLAEVGPARCGERRMSSFRKKEERPQNVSETFPKLRSSDATTQSTPILGRNSEAGVASSVAPSPHRLWTSAWGGRSTRSVPLHSSEPPESPNGSGRGAPGQVLNRPICCPAEEKRPHFLYRRYGSKQIGAKPPRCSTTARHGSKSKLPYPASSTENVELQLDKKAVVVDFSLKEVSSAALA